jgi:energy-coupling factor transport system substrate-specific component
MTSTTAPSTSTTTAAPQRGWRVVDIVVASVLGVAAGVVFWAWGLAWEPLSNLLVVVAPMAGLLAGGAAGVAVGLLDNTFTSNTTWEIGYQSVYLGCAVVSGVVVAGLLSWLAVRALAATGVLSQFAAGRTAREV